MKYIFYTFVLIIALVLQITIIDLLSIRKIKPDLLILAITYIGLSEGRGRTTVFGFLVGLLEDALGSGLLGIGSLAKSIVGFIAGATLGNRSIHHSYELALFASALALVHNLLMHSIISLGQRGFWQGLLQVALPSALYTFVAGLIVFSILPVHSLVRVKQSDTAAY